MGTEEEVNENRLKYGGWLLSLLAILAGAYFIWPRIHINLLGIVLIYFGIQIFNFSTLDEYKEKRIKLLHKLSNW